MNRVNRYLVVAGLALLATGVLVAVAGSLLGVGPDPGPSGPGVPTDQLDDGTTVDDGSESAETDSDDAESPGADDGDATDEDSDSGSGDDPGPGDDHDPGPDEDGPGPDDDTGPPDDG